MAVKAAISCGNCGRESGRQAHRNAPRMVPTVPSRKAIRSDGGYSVGGEESS